MVWEPRTGTPQVAVLSIGAVLKAVKGRPGVGVRERSVVGSDQPSPGELTREVFWLKQEGSAH